MKFQIVDAFTDTLFGGNPAGVVVIPDGKDYPEDEVMRRTAAELRYSETAFVKQEEDGVFRTRYFTPAAEVELCGHATIGSAYALMRFGMAQPGTVIRYETLAGAIDIVLREDSILMDMADPQAYGTIEGEEAVKELYRIMGIEAEGQGVWEKDPAVYLKPEKISTGLIDIMLPVKYTAHPEDSILDVLKMIDQTDVSNVPVVDDLGRLVGLLTNSNLVSTLSRQYLEEPTEEVLEND